MHVPGRKIWTAIAVMACLLGALFVFRIEILTSIGNFLVVQDPLERSDFIFVLNGEVATRPFHAAKLYRQRLADRVVIARAENSIAVEMGLAQNITDTSIAVMKKAGIPVEKIIQLPFRNGVTSTFDEAVALRSFAERNALHKVIVVTSAIHTRRARWIIKRALTGYYIQVSTSPVPDPRYTASTWWTQEDGLIGYQNEYLKLLHYLYKYR